MPLAPGREALRRDAPRCVRSLRLVRRERRAADAEGDSDRERVGAAVSFAVLEGWAVVDGYLPDGDTVRFVPDDMRAFLRLERSYLAAIGKDTSVCVRLEGIDAPELHYAGAQQPAAKPALDAMLRAIHWPSLAVAPSSASARIDGATPRGVRVAVLTNGCDSHGRAIGYLFPSEIAETHPSASRLLREEVLASSVNAGLVASGLVYPLSYRTQPDAHRAMFRELGAAARRRRAGVWARDESRAGFVLRSEASLGPYGALVFPKLFRRSVTFFREAARGVGFREWLRDLSGVDDEVSVNGGAFRPLSALLLETRGRVRLAADLLTTTFAGA